MHFRPMKNGMVSFRDLSALLVTQLAAFGPKQTKTDCRRGLRREIVSSAPFYRGASRSCMKLES
jgi:hypothetical protein